MLTDPPPHDPARLAAFLASDRCGTLELPPDDRLRTPALALEAALPHGTSTAVRDACVAFLIVAATLEAGARRLIAQSIAWVYAPGLEPHAEEDPLDLDAAGTAAITVRGVVALEQAVLTAPTLEGIVLRYGWLFGPGTGTDVAAGSPPLHVDAAALAAVLAIDRGAPGVYNIAEPSRSVSVEKARRELGWDPDFRSKG